MTIKCWYATPCKSLLFNASRPRPWSLRKMFHLRCLLFDWSPFARVPQLLGLLPRFIVWSLSALSRLQKCSSPMHARQAGQASTPAKASPFVSLYIWPAMISANVLYYSSSVLQCPLRQYVICRNAGVMLMTSFWSCNGFQGLVFVVSLVLPMLIQNGVFVSAHPAPHSLSIS